jgi:hypothetical protein
MSDRQHSLSESRVFRGVVFVVITLLLLARIGYGQLQAPAERKEGILQGSIHIEPLKTIPGDISDRIQPGSAVKISVRVENKGQHETPPGQLYVRYAFAHPLDKEESSIIFETKKKPLPAIPPEKTVEVSFDEPHLIPSLLDFVRYDWSLREYQAIAIINDKEHMIGTLAITFSAYYYPGFKKEFSAKIQAH